MFRTNRMNERPNVLAQRFFIPLLALGLLNRMYLLLVFGFKYVGNDDGVVWSAAVDYGHGLFREPYFYGQDYAIMLEALVAAPFTQLGIPFYILMPTVTSLLALAPFWSFAFWYRKHHHPISALIFLAMPVLLPLEYGMMTTMTRCFVSGIAPLAFLPWVLDLRRDTHRAFLIGLVLSAAAFINPNSLVFSIAFIVWFVLKEPRRASVMTWLAAGALPFISAFFAAQAYCRSHPESMVHVVHDWRMTFHPLELIPESFGMLNLHFAWLFPLLPTMGGLAFIALLLMAAWQIHRHNWACGFGLASAVLLIIFSFAFPKTHDGTGNVFFAYSRLYLALPLLLCWGFGHLAMGRRAERGTAIALLSGCLVATGLMVSRASETNFQDTGPHSPVAELPVQEVVADAANLLRLQKEHAVDLIVAMDFGGRIAPQFRCYLYPAIEAALAPTYMKGDRRFWQHDAYASRVVPTLLIVGGDSICWASWSNDDDRLSNFSDDRFGPLHLLRGNTEPTDSILDRFSRMK